MFTSKPFNNKRTLTDKFIFIFYPLMASAKLYKH